MKKAIVAVTAVALTFSAATSANAQEAKHQTKKVVKVKSKAGKSIAKKTKAVSSDAKKVKKSANDYFKVDKKGQPKKAVTKAKANKKYHSYKGQLIELPPLSRSSNVA